MTFDPWDWTTLQIQTILIIFTFLAVHNSSIGLIVPRLLVCLLPPTIRLFITLQSDPRDFVTFETFIQTDFERLTDFWKSFSNFESFQTKTILRLVTFETLSTILTIENLCYPAIHFDTGQHSQFLRCFIIVTRPPPNTSHSKNSVFFGCASISRLYPCQYYWLSQSVCKSYFWIWGIKAYIH